MTLPVCQCVNDVHLRGFVLNQKLLLICFPIIGTVSFVKSSILPLTKVISQGDNLCEQSPLVKELLILTESLKVSENT